MTDRRYEYMEPTLQSINGKYIRLVEQEVERNNKVLHKIMDILVAKMKTTDPLFDAIFDKIFYGGSFYDSLKVNNPGEYDLDLLLRLPKYAKPVLIESDVPGYLHLQLVDWEKFAKQPEFPKYRALEKYMDSSFVLQSSLIRRWMESITHRVENELHSIILNGFETFTANFCKNGPGLTLKIRDALGEICMDVDLVPAFTFFVSDWPKSYKMIDQSPTNEFFIIPKAPTGMEEENGKKYWRPSFQNQERIVIRNIEKLKPTIRLLKRLRDIQNDKLIASYYIKTIILNNHEEFIDQNLSLSAAFMKGLNIYAETILSGEVAYYWNPQNNLIAHIKRDTCISIGNCLKRIINNINRNINPLVIAKYLLTKGEYDEFQYRMTLEYHSSNNDEDDSNLNSEHQINEQRGARNENNWNNRSLLLGVGAIAVGLAAYSIISARRRNAND